MIASHVLHATAWSLLKLLPPRKALRWTARVARTLPPVDLDEARRIAAALDAHGTCLSRSFVVACRLRDAEVVVGVNPRSLGDEEPFGAHAWIEVAGAPLRDGDVEGHEIARLRPLEAAP